MAKATKQQKVDIPENGRPSLEGEDPEQLRQYYAQLLLLRRFEERTSEMYTKAKIGGYCHLNLGEEATIVGLMAALTPDDYLFTNYREHGYILARGVPPGPIMAELFGKATGVAKGRGGSMHLFDRAAHFMGGYAIVGGQLPLAIGAAYALKYQERPGVVIAQMGDATTNIGAWHESLNLAALWQLPVIFLVVNNGYGMGTTVAEGAAEPELFKRGCAFRMPGARVDGTEVLAMRDATARLRALAQAGQPSILEAVSFRFRGHSVIDSDRYREAAAVKAGRQAHDPLLRFAAQLSDGGLVDEAFLKETAARIEREVAEAIAFAEQSPDPEIADLFEYMYATPVPNTPGRAEAAALAAQQPGGG